jgi:hypothetical protein
MGTDIVAFRKTIFLGNLNNISYKKEYISFHQIWSNWMYTDFWPECLHSFWWKIKDYDSAQSIAQKIILYYPKDKDLLLFANWLKTFDQDIFFELSI